MTYLSTGDIRQVCEGETVLASIRFERLAGILWLTDLASQDTRALLILLRGLLSEGTTEPVYTLVRFDNPHFDKLIRLYRRLGLKADSVTFTFGEP